MRRNSQYTEVFNDGRITLAYPARLWAVMSAQDRAGVVQRQARLAAKLRRAALKKTAVSSYR